MTAASLRRASATAAAVILGVPVVPLHSSGIIIAQTPTACLAERSNGDRLGLKTSFDQYEREAAAANRAQALRTLKVHEEAAPTQSRGSLAYRAYTICLYKARLAQLGPAPAPVTIVANYAEKTLPGNIAQYLVWEWAGSSLVRPPAGTFTPHLQAIAALEAGPANGSQLLLLPLPLPWASNARQVLDALAPLQKIMMVAGPRAESAANSGFALFAPSRTPAARVVELIAQAREATSTTEFRNYLNFSRVPPASSDVETTLASVRGRLGQPPPTAPAQVAATPNIMPGTASAGTWPLGIAPGNLYVIGSQLVSATSPAEALDAANRAMKFYYPYATSLPTPTITRECKGPNWGAIVYHAEEMGQGRANFGWACGAATPGDALRLAGEECTKRRGSPCVQDSRGSVYLKFMVGHSGELYSGLNNSDPMWMTSQLWAMAPPVNNTEMLVQSPEHAIAGLGGMCSQRFGGAQVPCFVTFRGYECTQYRGNGHPSCLDALYTARGVEPLRNPIFVAPRRP